MLSNYNVLYIRLAGLTKTMVFIISDKNGKAFFRFKNTQHNIPPNFSGKNAPILFINSGTRRRTASCYLVTLKKCSNATVNAV